MKKLLIVDLQKQFADKNGKYKNILNNINSLKKNYDKVYATIFSQNLEDNRNINYQNKLNWNECLNCSYKDLEFDINKQNVIIKNGYGIKNISKYFSFEDTIDIIGCDSEACIMAICFQLWDLGFNFNILSNYIYTTSLNYTDEDVKKLLIENFGECVK